MNNVSAHLHSDVRVALECVLEIILRQAERDSDRSHQVHAQPVQMRHQRLERIPKASAVALARPLIRAVQVRVLIALGSIRNIRRRHLAAKVDLLAVVLRAVRPLVA